MDHSGEFEQIAERLSGGDLVASFKTRRMAREGGNSDIWLTASALTDDKGRLAEIAITERDLAWLAGAQGA
jgi:hypothetical protein